MFPPILTYNGYYERGRKIAFSQHVLWVVALGRRLEIQRVWHYSYLLNKGDLIPGSTLRLRREESVYWWWEVVRQLLQTKSGV